MSDNLHFEAYKYYVTTILNLSTGSLAIFITLFEKFKSFEYFYLLAIALLLLSSLLGILILFYIVRRTNHTRQESHRVYQGIKIYINPRKIESIAYVLQSVFFLLAYCILISKLFLIKP